jgi:hypothetical protein
MSSGSAVTALCKTLRTALAESTTSPFSSAFSSLSRAQALSASSSNFSTSPFPLSAVDVVSSSASTRAFAGWTTVIPLGKVPILSCESDNLDQRSRIASISLSRFLSSATCVARRACNDERARCRSVVVCLCAASVCCWERAAILPPHFRRHHWSRQYRYTTTSRGKRERETHVSLARAAAVSRSAVSAVSFAESCIESRRS